MINNNYIDFDRINIKSVASVYNIIKTSPWSFNAAKYAQKMRTDEYVYQLCFHINGSFINEFKDGEKYEIISPIITFTDIRDNEFINKSVELPYQYYAITFNCYHNIFPENYNLRQLSVHPRNSFSFENLFIEAQDIFTKKNQAWEIKIKAVVFKILSDFFSEYQEKEVQSVCGENILNAKRLIDKDIFNKNISIADIAAEIGLCPEYFTRTFKKSYGLSPKQYIINSKLDRAAALLINTNKPIYEICDLCFFSDSSYFNKKFLEKFKMSPIQYRKSKSFHI